jgi:phospholipid/cholesterol/gamma-HCH transport system substrate-binding protein
MAETGHKHEGGLSVRDQIERYRTAFISIVVMIVIAAGVGGYILAHENLKLPGWVPVFGRNYYTLKADIQTAQAVTPGQGQAVTIAGAKIGEVDSVDLHDGVAQITMKVTPKYARIYHNATLILRPKTQLQDITVEVNPGTPSAGKLPSGSTLPLSQTAPNVNFDEFLSSLDAETRSYLQELLAGAGQGFGNNGKAFSATLKRFDPLAREVKEISSELSLRHANTARAIHNFRLLTEALGGKDKQLAQLVDASNAVFGTFAKEDQNVQSLVRQLPGALNKTKSGLGKLATAAHVLGPTLHKLQPFASALGPANEATRKLSLVTRSRSSPRRSACSTNSSTSSHTIPARAKAASCSSSTGPTTTSTASSAPPTPTACSAARSSISTAKSRRSSKTSDRSTRTSTCSSACCSRPNVRPAKRRNC